MLLAAVHGLTSCSGAYEEYAELPEARFFPELHISVPANDIDRYEWAEAAVSLKNFGDEGFMSESAQVRGRGTSTWHDMGEKRPYRIRFDEARPMFGGNYAARDWNLLANAADFSMLRNYAAFYLGYLLSGFDFSPAHHFVHLYLDGDYRGVYMVSDQMHVHPGRIELNYNPDPALSEYLLEWCFHQREEGEIYFLAGGIQFVLDFPDLNALTYEHREFAQQFIIDVTEAIQSGDMEILRGFMDIPSFLDFYLVNELFKNADAGFSSLFFQIRQTEDGPKLFAGPLWDFDQSAGGSFSVDWYSNYSPKGMWAAYANRWFASLLLMPEFRDMALSRWNEIRCVEVAEIIASVRFLALAYAECFERNFERWPDKLGNYLWRTPPTVMGINSFAGQAEYLADWFEERVFWMDGFLQIQ
jgi:hypothetical protein